MRRVLLIGLLVASTTGVQAQELSAADSAEIQQKALRHVRQLEGLLNLIAQPDKYFRKYSFNKLIQSFYEEESSYRIFRDSLATMEDDLNPKAQPDDNYLLTAKNYLQAFFSLYEKSPVTSVFFGNYEVSPIQQGEFIYVEVFFTSEFTNKHRIFSDYPYPVRHKKATLRAQPQADGWEVVISDISVYSPDEDLIASPSDDTSSVSPPSLPERIDPPDELAAQSGPAVDTADLSSMLALRGGEYLEKMSDILADSTQTEQVLSRLDRGSQYQLRLYSAANDEPEENLPSVGAPPTVKAGSTEKSSTPVFDDFAPKVKRIGESSIQVMFFNPDDAPLSVALMNLDGQALYTGIVESQKRFAKVINLKQLDQDHYQVRVFNDNYDYKVPVDYQSTLTIGETEEVPKRSTPDSSNPKSLALENTSSKNKAEETAESPKPENTKTKKRKVDVFKDFDPYVMKRDGQPSVQVIFKNPASDSLSVELMDAAGWVLYSERVAAQQSYTKSINMKGLDRGAYRVRISNDDYNHTARIYH